MLATMVLAFAGAVEQNILRYPNLSRAHEPQVALRLLAQLEDVVSHLRESLS
jgi:hypothetical protein